MRLGTAILATTLTLAACSSEKEQPALFRKILPSHSGIQFANNIQTSKELNIFNYRNFYNGGGVAIGDINNDGLSDIYFTANMGQNKLYLNKGNFHFEDITEKAGVGGTKSWSTGVVMADINHDGWLDIYVCNAGYFKGDDQKNELFINPGNATSPGDWEGSFTEQAADYRLDEAGYTTHAAFFDYDLDGDLDCYILNNSFMPVNTLNYSNKREVYAEDWPVKDFLKGGGDKLLRNDDGKYYDVTKEAGIYGSLIGFGLGITIGDINGDNLPDMYVSNDFFERDYLYINKGDGTFSEEIEKWVSHLSHASMGADLADINNDGYPEIFVTEMLPDDEYRLKTTTLFEDYKVYQEKQKKDFYHQYMQNTLQLNNKDQTYSEIAFYSGVAASDWSWGALMFDMDNDGLRDIYICNGIYHDLVNQDFINFFADEVIQKMVLTGEKEDMLVVIDKMPSSPLLNKAFHNGGDLTFQDVGKEWGFETPSFSNGAAYSDLDNDGDLDLVVNNLNMESFVFENMANEKLGNHYLSIKLEGAGKNTKAIGAKVFLYKKGEVLNAQLIPTRGFQSSVDYKMVFGLGESTTLDSLVILWPDMKKTLLLNPPVDTTLSFSYLTSSPYVSGSPFEKPKSGNHFFEEIEQPFVAHAEDRFVDFYQEGLTMRMVSREGPKAVTGDIDGDGNKEIIIGGAAGQPPAVYKLTGERFVQMENTGLENEAAFEDTALELFDADGDSDLDLFIGSGGNHRPMGHRDLQDRIYLNNGKGEFSVSPRALTMNGFNTSVAIPFDFDEDGDMDLFVGCRSIPGKYGVPTLNAIYQNDGSGLFENVSKKIAPDFITIGMVTDAKLVDVTGDGNEELVVVGEWTSPKVFTFSNGKFEKIETNLSDYHGWWYAIEKDDVDGDGDMDLILGNRGENFYFTGSPDAQARLWVKDFDGNGTVEKIITRSINGKDMPVPMQNELTGQIVSLKKQNLKHSEYAKKSIQELFGKEALKKAIVWRGNYFKSAVAINEGNGQFTMKPLPKEVQFSCVCDIYCKDLNMDGHNDLVLAGNDSGFTPQFSKLDASFGHVLLGKGNGEYERVENRDSGFFVKGDVRQLIEIEGESGKYLLVTVNDQKPKLYKLEIRN